MTEGTVKAERHAFKKRYENVLCNEGINVWHYTYKNGELACYPADGEH